MKLTIYALIAAVIAVMLAGADAQFGGQGRGQYQGPFSDGQRQGGGFGGVEQGAGGRGYRQQDAARSGGPQETGKFRTNVIDTPDSYGYEATYPGGRARYINHRSQSGPSFASRSELDGRGPQQRQFAQGNRDQWNN